jgi:hypothetical protein
MEEPADNIVSAKATIAVSSHFLSLLYSNASANPERWRCLPGFRGTEIGGCVLAALVVQALDIESYLFLGRDLSRSLQLILRWTRIRGLSSSVFR